MACGAVALLEDGQMDGWIDGIEGLMENKNRCMRVQRDFQNEGLIQNSPQPLAPLPEISPQCKRLTVSPPLGINRSLPSRKACSERGQTGGEGGQFLMIPVTHSRGGWFQGFLVGCRGSYREEEGEGRCSQRQYKGGDKRVSSSIQHDRDSRHNKCHHQHPRKLHSN